MDDYKKNERLEEDAGQEEEEKVEDTSPLYSREDLEEEAKKHKEYFEEEKSKKKRNIKNIIILVLTGVIAILLVFFLPFTQKIDEVIPVVVEKGGNVNDNEKEYVYVKGSIKAPLVFFGSREFKGNIYISYIDIPGQTPDGQKQVLTDMKKGLSSSDIILTPEKGDIPKAYNIAKLKSKGLFSYFEIEITNFEKEEAFKKYTNDRIFGPAFNVDEKEEVKKVLRVTK